MAANDPALATLFHGDVTVEIGSDTSLYGLGSFSAYNTGYFGYGSPVQSTNTASGSIVSYGGLGVYQDVNIGGQITVNSTSNLQTTFIDTTLGSIGLNVSGANLVNIAVVASVSIYSSAETVSISSDSAGLTLLNSGKATLTSDQNSSTAIDIINSDSGGGVRMLSGSSSGLEIIAGSGGIIGTASTGNVSLTANSGNAILQVNSTSSGHDVLISQTGSFDSGVKIISAGTNASVKAIELSATNSSGDVYIHNNLTGTGSTSLYTGSGGLSATTFTGGSIALTSNAANSSYIVNSTGGSGQSLTVSVQGAELANNQLLLQSNGTNTTQAILIQTSSTTGGILINQPALSTGAVIIHSGSGGLTADTNIGGSINLTSNGATSTYTNATTGDGQDLHISVTGSNDASVIISSTGTGLDAISLNTSVGGLLVNSNGAISINTTDTSTGIEVGTYITGVPIGLGTINSTTTVYGNLDVRGTTTTLESTIVQIVDNIIQINNGPSGTADGGVAVKRYQPANNTSSGDVVNDTPTFTGVSDATGTSTTIKLTGGSSTVGEYNGWWVLITSGTGSGQVRRIKSYNGSSTKIATIYDTSDQTGALDSPTPIEGLTFLTIPDNTSAFSLFPCHWVISMYDESEKEWALVCSPFVTAISNPSIAEYVDLHIKNLIADNITVNTINNSTSDQIRTFTLDNTNTTPVELDASNLTPATQVFSTFGIHIILVQPSTATNTFCWGLFMIGSRGASVNGTTTRMISVKGSLNQQLNMAWNTLEKPTIFYQPAPTGGTGTTDFKMKIISL
jgi:hypothetical protein